MIWRVFSMGHCNLLKKNHSIAARLSTEGHFLRSTRCDWIVLVFCTKVDQKTLQHGTWLARAKIPFFGEKLPNDVGKGTTIEPLLHRFHRLRATMGATLNDLRWDYTVPLVNCHCLMDNRPKECCLFMCLSFVPDAIPPRGLGGGNFVPPLVRY